MVGRVRAAIRRVPAGGCRKILFVRQLRLRDVAARIKGHEINVPLVFGCDAGSAGRCDGG
jgi:hypothetical protein